MRTIDRQSSFKRDFKREKLSGKHKNFDALIVEVLGFLVIDSPLPERYKNHALIGQWLGYSECHIKPDLLLIYEKIGSHSELFD